MGILEMFGKRFFGQGAEQHAKKDQQIEEVPVKKKRRKRKKRAEHVDVQKETSGSTRKKKQSARESAFPEVVPSPQKKSWQEIIQQQKLVIFPITRNELATTLSSVKALQEAILERRPEVPFESVLGSPADYGKILQRWLRNSDDDKIALFDTFLHRSNAQASSTEVDENLLQVFQDSFALVHYEKQQRQSFVFRSMVLQHLNELIHGGGGGEIGRATLPGPDEFHKKLSTFFPGLHDKHLEKLEAFLRKAQEVSDTPEKKKAIDVVARAALLMIEQEKKGRSSYVYRGKILAGVGRASQGGIASRDDFRRELVMWLKTAKSEQIAPLEQMISRARERIGREKVSEDVRQVIGDVEALLSEETSRRKADDILKNISPEKKGKSVTIVAPPEEIREVLISEKKEDSENKKEMSTPPSEKYGMAEIEVLKKEETAPEKKVSVYELHAIQPNELRARILQRIGSPDTEIAVGQKYFENRLREWMEFSTTTDQQKKDALKNIGEELRAIESDLDVRKRKEKIKIFQRAEEILRGEVNVE